MKTIEDMFRWISGNQVEFKNTILEHLSLVGWSVGLALIIGVLIGIVLSRNKSISEPVISLINLVQMLPSLVLLALMLPIFGIGFKTAIIALFIRAILPILKNTYVGIVNIDPSLRDAALGMGMTSKQLLFRVELPLAFPVIVGGIKIALILAISLATLSALVGAGGLGNIIFAGLQLLSTPMLLAGTSTAIIMGLGSYAIMSYIESILTRYDTDRKTLNL